MSYGPSRFFDELRALGHEVVEQTAPNGQLFAVIEPFEITLGRFAGRAVGLGLQTTPDFPKTVASAIHVKASPQLYEPKDNEPNVRNISASVLGTEWRYWSHNFGWNEERSARHLMSQVNGIFAHAK